MKPPRAETQEQLALGTIIVSNGCELRGKLQDFPWATQALRSKIVVAYVKNDELIGVCAIRGKLNYLCLYIREGYRQKGMGKLLLKNMVIAARANGISFLSLIVSSKNYSAVHLYYKFGFKKVCTYNQFSPSSPTENLIMFSAISSNPPLIFFIFIGLFTLIPRIMLSKAMDLAKGRF